MQQQAKTSILLSMSTQFLLAVHLLLLCHPLSVPGTKQAQHLHLHPIHRQQASFAATLRASAGIIEISDSPVRPQKQQRLVNVKTEIEEKDPGLGTTSKPDLGFNNHQKNMAEETESAVNDATMLADMETVEESLQQGVENLMDEMEEVA